MRHIADAWRKAGHQPAQAPDPARVWDRERADAESLFRGVAQPEGGSPRFLPERPRAVADRPSPPVAAETKRHERGEHLGIHDELVRLTQLLFVAPVSAPRTVMFCAIDGSPSPHVSFLVAQVLAGSNIGTVCFVDATMDAHAPKPALDMDAAGLSADGALRFLEEWADPVADNLWSVRHESMAARQRRPSSEEWLFELRERFNYVIVAGPPVLACAEAIAIAAAVEGVVLLIDEPATRRDVAKAAVATLGKSAARVLGVVITNRSYPIPSALYHRL